MSTGIEFRHLCISIPRVLALSVLNRLSEDYARFTGYDQSYDYLAFFIEYGSSNAFTRRGQVARRWSLQCIVQEHALIERACNSSACIHTGSLRVQGRRLTPEGYISLYRRLPRIGLADVALGGRRMTLREQASPHLHPHPWQNFIGERVVVEDRATLLGKETVRTLTLAHEPAQLAADFCYLAEHYPFQQDSSRWPFGIERSWEDELDRAHAMAPLKMRAA